MKMTLKMRDKPRLHVFRRSIIQDQFKLIPSEKFNEAFKYCLGYALQKYGLRLHYVTVFANTYILLVSEIDEDSDLSAFQKRLNTDLTKIFNKVNDSKGTIWAPHSFYEKVIHTQEEFEFYVVKTRTRLVRSGLVERPEQWTGISLSAQELGCYSETVGRPEELGLDPDRPETVTIQCTLPELPNEIEAVRAILQSSDPGTIVETVAELRKTRRGSAILENLGRSGREGSGRKRRKNRGRKRRKKKIESQLRSMEQKESVPEFRNRMERLINKKVQEAQDKRRELGLGYLGMSGVQSLGVNWNPDLLLEIKGISLHSISLETDEIEQSRLESGVCQVQYRKRYKQFIKDYRKAFKLWRNQEPAVFPLGTYYMRKVYNVPCLE